MQSPSYKAKSGGSSNVGETSLPDELNAFYARFDRENTDVPSRAPIRCDGISVSVTEADVRKSFRGVNPRKAPGPDGIPGRVLKTCADQLAGVFTDIFNLSLLRSEVPTCFKRASIIPVPKKSKVTCLNDYRPVALTPVVMKCFERLIMAQINSYLDKNLDPLQFAYRHNRSTVDAISLALHSALDHLDNKNSYVRLLFIDYSSAFNTIIPSKLVTKLAELGPLRIPLQLDPRLPHSQTTVCSYWWKCVSLDNNQHGSTSRLRAQPPAVLTLYS